MVSLLEEVVVGVVAVGWATDDRVVLGWGGSASEFVRTSRTALVGCDDGKIGTPAAAAVMSVAAAVVAAAVLTTLLTDGCLDGFAVDPNE